jgi:hypothetical protein
MEGTTSKPRAVATRPVVLDDPDPGRTAPDEPQRTDIVITGHARDLTATAVDLTSEAVPANEDIVALRLQRDSTRITILGSLAELDDLVAEITAEVDRIHRQRADAADSSEPALLAQLEASVAARAKARPGEPVNTLASLLPPSGPEAA